MESLQEWERTAKAFGAQLRWTPQIYTWANPCRRATGAGKETRDPRELDSRDQGQKGVRAKTEEGRGWFKVEEL